jgi:hypothetical protein
VTAERAPGEHLVLKLDEGSAETIE